MKNDVREVSHTRVCQISLSLLRALLGAPNEAKRHFTDIAASGHPHVIRMLQWKCGCRALSVESEEVPIVPCEFHTAYLRGT
ncbi:MAG TPA: hypothetical protein VMF11_09060 [Candidatus Baltobacteraceae bacterium]|nr:hypothetical protein [Candidatus Baltobacteraceae bacterium]